MLHRTMRHSKLTCERPVLVISASHLPATVCAMYHSNLLTRHLPRMHDHMHTAEALKSATMEWKFDLQHQVVAFTTDNGSNIVKAIDSDLQ